MNEIVISVSQLNLYIRQIFDAEELLYNISVKGEISGLKIARDVAFFSLKDENCQIPCVCFNVDIIKLFHDGDMVIARGSPKFYAKGGKLDFNINKITRDGKGDIFLQFLQLKERLESEGLFDAKFKKLLPQNIKVVGVVTSETGAVIKDIINITTRRNHGVDIVIYPAKVQGESAKKEIINGINFFSNYNVDVIIIARGGGSFEDLNVFNSEEIARCVFNCTKPLISAIGHETDFTILDFVADIRAPTPSAAAELITSDLKEKKLLIIQKYEKLNLIIQGKFSDLKYQLNLKRNSFLKNMQNLNDEQKYYITIKAAMLEKLNPKNILKSGYAKISKNMISGEETVISATQLQSDDEILISFYDGKIVGNIK
ncbi:MAG: exodeoxyribonuclease VII large subunit [Clostridia bacterium]|nr:exodeoxyribonuclease VII large subunit [Clostridia bacterium]